LLDENAIAEALGAVHGPDGKTPLPQSGAIGGLTQRDGKVYLSIVVDPAQADKAEAMRKAAETALRGVEGVTAAIVTLTSERMPGAPPAHNHGHGHSPAPAGKGAPRRVPESVAGVRNIVAVASGKGGVGKSTVAANLAIAMGQEGWRVGLLDADVFGPSAPRLFGLTEKPKVEQSFLVPLLAYGVKVISIGLMIEEESPVVWRGPMVMSAVTQLLREVAWGELDCLVVDMPPGTGDVQLTMEHSGARHYREHELFHLPALPGAQRYFRPWRRASRSRKAGRRLPRRSAARHGDPRNLRCRAPDRRRRSRWRTCGGVSRDRARIDRQARRAATRRA
jgi:ATP-binding protein involved in chromosome partitioning